MTNGQQLGRTLTVSAERLRYWVEKHQMTLTLAWVSFWSTLVATVTVIVCR